MNIYDITLLRDCRVNETVTLSDGRSLMRVPDDDPIDDPGCFDCVLWHLSDDKCPNLHCTSPFTHFVESVS